MPQLLGIYLIDISQYEFGKALEVPLRLIRCTDLRQTRHMSRQFTGSLQYILLGLSTVAVVSRPLADFEAVDLTESVTVVFRTLHRIWHSGKRT